ncbi:MULTISPECIES: cation diffusion facilitator family transporter [Staphylococcus]|uniref:cation diffusion facilitator family transporter n=1 Tax=Staphylococcus TaxID=1279 RepID=UPI000D02EE4A|nr:MULTISPECIES: cation diffusion facilitator family transporter [Staphylococcus]
MSQSLNLKRAQKGAYLSLVTYIVLSVAKYIVGTIYHSAAVRADALNNMTDILVSIAVIVGLKISIKPPDKNHPYGHLKSENIASLLVSFIIMFVGVQVIIQDFPRLFLNDYHTPNPVTIIISLISGAIMSAVALYNFRLAKQTKSRSLHSSAVDNMSDSIVSLGTGVGLIFTQFGMPIVDIILAIILGFLIVYTGFSIFREAIFTLSDGFNERDLETYRQDVLEVSDVLAVKSIKGRYHGSSIFVDVTIVVEPDLTLQEAHEICDRVETYMHEQGVSSVYVHPEPYHPEAEGHHEVHNKDYNHS